MSVPTSPISSLPHHPHLTSHPPPTPTPPTSGAVTPNSDSYKGPHLSTVLIHHGSPPDPSTSAVIPPLSLSTTFAQSRPGVALYPHLECQHGVGASGALDDDEGGTSSSKRPFFEYSRSGNPNRLAFEGLLEAMEMPKDLLKQPAEQQDHQLPRALAFSSGSAVTAAIVGALLSGKGNAKPGHVICGSDVYGGTFRYFSRVAPELQGVETTFLNMSLNSRSASATRSTPETTDDVKKEEADLETQIEGAFRENTKIVWLESPTNPTLLISSIKSIAKLAHAHGALLVVDSTFLSPYYQRSLREGADIVVHSITKYINGHSDVVMGCCVSPHREVIEKLRFWQNAAGAVPSSFDCWLAMRGAKTLELRMRRHGFSALMLARWLHSVALPLGYIREVIYPGLAKQGEGPRERKIREVAWNQLAEEAREFELEEGRNLDTGFSYGGMVAVRIGPPNSNPEWDDKRLTEVAVNFLSSLRLFTLAESLGGVESLAELPALMTHSSVSEENRAKLGIDGGLVRLSVGVEDWRDLKRDLERGFEKTFGKSGSQQGNGFLKANGTANVAA